MGSGETETSAKVSKAPATPEQPPTSSTGAVYPDWTGFQAYSPIPPHGFFHSQVASSPQAHPYMWGAQHLMPPYATPPPPYVAMYPHGGIYAHPSMPPGSVPFSPYAMPSPNGNAEASGTMHGGVEGNGKERSPLKRSKGSLGSLNMLTGKNTNEQVKTSATSAANGVFSQSAESASEGSSEGSDANSQNDSQHKACHRQDSLQAEASQNGNTACGPHNGVPTTRQHAMMNPTMSIMPVTASGAPGGVAGPTTNLNIGMDYWGTPTPSAIPAIRGKVPSAPAAGAMVPTTFVGSREGVQSEHWDERELKRQKRKQSNRESARRSRLRKQAECEELAKRVEDLKEENSTLKSEVSRIRSEYENLLSQNNSLKERLGEIPRGHESRNDQHSGADDQQAGQTELVQSGH